MPQPSPHSRSAHEMGAASNGAASNGAASHGLGAGAAIGNGRPGTNGGPVPSAEPVTTLRQVDDEVLELSDLRPVMARRTLGLVTERLFDVVDVTDPCAELIADSGIREGTLTVFSRHTTCAVRINERETCFLEDLRLFMRSLVPEGSYYRHDDFEIRDPDTLACPAEDEPINGHSHIKHMLMGAASETVPISGGSMDLGQWQRIMFIELDQSRSRKVCLQVQGWA